jgi:hypothetical protein
MEDIRQIDTQREGLEYSPFPLMTRALLVSDILPLIPHLDSSSSENSTFWTVTFVGLGGWAYFGMQSLSHNDCDDDRPAGRYYTPSLKEIIEYHHRERDLFWDTYVWSTAWMAGVALTSNYSERKTAALIALIIPFGFSFSKRWSAFAEDNDLQISLAPVYQDQKIVFNPIIRFSW